MPQPNDVVNLWTYVDEWTRCISSGYQRDSLYRHGRFDSCSAQFSDLSVALKAKMMNDKDKAASAVSETHYRKNLGSDPANSPTAGYIWDLKKVPGWEVVDDSDETISSSSHHFK